MCVVSGVQQASRRVLYRRHLLPQRRNVLHHYGHWTKILRVRRSTLLHTYSSHAYSYIFIFIYTYMHYNNMLFVLVLSLNVRQHSNADTRY